MTDKIINISHLSKSFPGGSKVLDDINLYIRRGEFLTLLGPSGCGKTTMLRMIAGFLQPDEGSITMDGKELTGVPPHLRPLNTVFQRYALFPHLDVYDNIAFGLKLKGTPEDEIDKRVRKVLKLVSMSDYEDRDVNSLSGGQQQRIAIARAIVNRPKVLLLDEPLSNLDAKLRVQLRNELKKMQKDFGITTIYVTHDQEEALTLSDRIAVFNKGYIEQIGTPNEVYNYSKTEFVCNFIGDINRLSDEVVHKVAAAGGEIDPRKHNYVRLERLHVNVDTLPGQVALDGTVTMREYYGLYIKYYIDLGSQTIKVIEKNDGVRIYEEGQKVSVILDPRDVMAYEPGEDLEVAE